MAKSSIVSFNAGEWSPKLDGRTDLAKYANACREVKNVIVETYGCVSRRVGTQYIAPAKLTNRVCRMVDFQFSATTTFMLELGHNYIRFFSNGIQVLLSGSPYEISSPYEDTDVFNLQFAQSNDVVFICHPDFPRYELSRLTDTSWTLAESVFEVPPFLDENLTNTTLALGATTGVGVALVASASTFVAGHVGSFWQIAHLRPASTEFIEITANGTSNNIAILGDWNIRTYGIWNANIYVERSLDGGTTWDTIRIFAGREDRNVDAVGTQEVEALFRLAVDSYTLPVNPGTTTPRAIIEAVDAYIYGIVKITAVTNGTNAVVTVLDQAYSTDATKVWAEGAWSAVRGYPRALTIFEQRLIHAGTTHQPQTYWLSKTGDYDNYRYGTKADDAFTYTMGAKRQQAILWLVAQKVLLTGTTLGEWVMSSGDREEPLSITNAAVRPQSEYGSGLNEAKLVNDTVLFVQRNRRKVREFTFSLERDKYVAPDLTLLAEHITGSGIVQMATQQLPINILWCVTTDGRLIGMTYERDQDVVAWHEHETDGFFESVAVITGSANDEVWFSVRRTINGSTKRYIERFNPTEWTEVKYSFFVDCGVTYNFFPFTTTNLTGLSHLEGKTLSILADGLVVSDKTVVSGAVTLDEAAMVIQIGLPYESVTKPMRLDTNAALGETMGQVKRVTGLFLRFLNTIGCTVGDGADYEDEISFRTVADLMDEQAPLFTGDFPVDFEGDLSYEGDIVITQNQPLPMTLLAMVIKYEVTSL